jgi:hypothetical protein
MTWRRIRTKSATSGSTDSRTAAITAGTLIAYWPSNLVRPSGSTDTLLLCVRTSGRMKLFQTLSPS